MSLPCLNKVILSYSILSNKLTLLPMGGFIAQLVEHRTGIAEVMGSNLVEALIFFFFFFFQASSFQLLELENLLRWLHFTFKTCKVAIFTVFVLFVS